MEIRYSGFIALAGRPNVGKSTLLNSLTGEKIAIVSPRPQTTRNRIIGIRTEGDTQFVFVDTPGLHSPKTALGEYMVKTADENMKGTDVIVLVVEPVPNIGKPEQKVIKTIRAENTKSILVINKVDTLKDKSVLMEVIKLYSAEHEFDAVVPLSAAKNKGTDILLDELRKLMPEGVQYYPEDMVSDQPARVRAAEIIREKMLYLLSDEIPHGLAIDITSYTERQDREITDINADIICEKSSHKAIIIGKNGEMLKRIGSLARKDIEEMLGEKVNLQCWVKVKEDWRNSRYLVRDFGYDDR